MEAVFDARRDQLMDPIGSSPVRCKMFLPTLKTGDVCMKITRTLLCAASLAAVLALSACGKSDDSASTPAPDATPPAAATAAPAMAPAAASTAAMAPASTAMAPASTAAMAPASASTAGQ
jgi:hypothetical protein